MRERCEKSGYWYDGISVSQYLDSQMKGPSASMMPPMLYFVRDLYVNSIGDTR
jgi:hypothetical protein